MRRARLAAFGLIGLLSLVTAPAAAGTTSYTYDALGRVITAIYPDGSTATYTYDAVGNRTVYVTAAPSAPTAGNVSATVAVNSSNDPISLSITGVATSVAVSTGPAHGTATASGTAITYTPTNGYSGSDSFHYTASNSGGTSAPATASITVTTNAPPIAGPAGATVAENSSSNPITLGITGGTPTSVAVSTAPSHGTTSVTGTTIKYTPTGSYFGPDDFAYTATNAYGTSSPAIAAITVNPLPPIAGAASATVSENTANNPIALSITGGTPTSVAVSTAPTHGSATAVGTSIAYTPSSGYAGSDSFRYTASNPGGTSAAATVTITVNSLALPVANASSANVYENTTSNPVSLNITGGAAKSVAVSTAPGHGTAVASGTAIAYTPASGYVGSDSFQYSATNSVGTSAAATVTITVSPMSASFSPVLNCPTGTPTYVCASAKTNNHTFAATTVSVTGGSGYYTYAWSPASPSNGTWATGSTATISPAVSNVAGTAQATYSCTVTDTVTGLQATSNAVLYQYTQNIGGGGGGQ